MGTEDAKVTAMNMYKYKERLRLYKRLQCSTYFKQSFSLSLCGPISISRAKRVLMGLTDRRKTSKNLVDSRKN